MLDNDDGPGHSNPVEEDEVTDSERAEMLREYLDAFAAEFGQVPQLMPLDDEGKEPAIRGMGRGVLDSPEGRDLLTDGDEAVRRIREDGVRGFCLYAGREDHGTANVVFADHDDMAAFLAPTGEPTLEVVSGSGRGVHETYRNAGNIENAQVGKGEGEVRAENWYVVVPGSIHPTGGIHHIVENREIATLSNADLADHMKPASRTSSRNSATDGTEEPCTTVESDPEK